MEETDVSRDVNGTLLVEGQRVKVVFESAMTSETGTIEAITPFVISVRYDDGTQTTWAYGSSLECIDDPCPRCETGVKLPNDYLCEACRYGIESESSLT